MSSISSTERKFIQNGVAQNIRNDGRERLDFRAFTLETGVVPQASGSCRLHIDTTDVLVGVKVELGEPELQTPALGKVIVSVEWHVSRPSPLHWVPLTRLLSPFQFAQCFGRF
jgi:exosome complex component RRP42